MRSQRSKRFLGAGGTRRGVGARTAPEQRAMFEDPDEVDDPADRYDLGELARDCRRMTLESSSGVYAQRRSVW